MLLMNKIEHACKTIKHVQRSKDKQHKLDYLMTHKSEELERILWYAYNPLFDFGVTKEMIQEYCGLVSDYKEYDESIFDILDGLMNRQVSGASACGVILSVKYLLSDNIYELLINIISRDLKLGVSIDEINDVFGNRSYSKWHIPPKHNGYLRERFIKRCHINKYADKIA